jgi:hypothetical protein
MNTQKGATMSRAQKFIHALIEVTTINLNGNVCLKCHIGTIEGRCRM